MKNLKIGTRSLVILICTAFLFGCKKESSEEICVPVSWYQDSDGDGFGNSAVAVLSCIQPAGFVSLNNDCDDKNRAVNPGAVEISGDDIDNNCDGESLISIGDYYHGGIVFFIDDSGEHGLISATIDQGTNILWCNDTINCFVRNTRREIGYGKQNTEYIVNYFGQGNYAAYLCSSSTLNTYDDWYLPSYDELELMYNNLHLAGLGAFESKAYWSSSHEDPAGLDADVYYKSFTPNQPQFSYTEPYDKGTKYINVRAIREF